MEDLLPRVRLAGVTLFAGAVAWAVSTVVAGESVQTHITTLSTVTGILYLLGVATLTWVILTTRAAGNRVIPVAQLVLVAGALVYSFAEFAYERHADMPSWLVVADVCWPLANLCTLVMGAAVAWAGRWRGLARWYPLVGGCWLVVMIPVKNVIGMGVGVYVSAAWLLGSYAVLGLALALRPEIVRPGGTPASAPLGS